MRHPRSYYHDIGLLGEDFVCQWLQSTGWIILHRRWRCRVGEIDIITEKQEDNYSKFVLAFVEIKTRNPRNWDEGGRCAITSKKQQKLWRTAEIFLARFPEKANYFCRFDVAIVCITENHNNFSPSSLYHLSTPQYQLFLEEYIPGAFTINS